MEPPFVDEKVYSPMDAMMLGLQLAKHWGLLRTSDAKTVIVANWDVEDGQAVRQPGVTVVRDRKPGEPAVIIQASDFRSPSFEKTMTWLVDNINQAMDEHEQASG